MIVYNAVRCNKCGGIAHSKHTHDFVYCKCESIAVDGGTSYLKRMGDIEDYEDLSLTDEAPIEDIREVFRWGNNYSKDKVLLPETNWILLREIDSEYLEALIEYTVGKEVNGIFKREKLFRETLDIKEN